MPLIHSQFLEEVAQPQNPISLKKPYRSNESDSDLESSLER